jgi:hypothetical protein
LNGELIAAGESLDMRDAVAVTETTSFEIKAKSYAEVLVIEVPMEI